MSRPHNSDRLPSRSPIQARRKPPVRLPSLGTSGQRLPGPSLARRASVSGLTAAPKGQRTSKTTHKLVVLPSAPQTRLPEDDLTLGVEIEGGIREYKSEAERMTKEQRKKAGFKRITAYCVAESLQMKLLVPFLKREHNVAPRIFDEALYVMYHLPLLPGYGRNANVRSSVPAPTNQGASCPPTFSEAEEDGYQGSYFTQPISRSKNDERDGYISSSSPVDAQKHHPLTPSSTDVIVPEAILASETNLGTTIPSLSPENEPWSDSELVTNTSWKARAGPGSLPPVESVEDDVVEAVFFEYGVVVFFGLMERQEMDILEDIENAGIMKRKINEDDWEIEECHFKHDPYIAYPRIYNDFFTLKSRSHLLKLSIAHALAQSTLLAHYETIARHVLSSPGTLSIPRQLAESGGLKLRRHEALKLTGKLFKLRRDINLVSNVLDVPELFWSEASLKDLYDAVREYMEIGPRVQVLNEKLGVASDFLDAIHDHLNNSAMSRITWIVIWLIVVAILVELGEVIARLVVHATLEGGSKTIATIADASNIPSQMSREEAIRALERLILLQE